MTPQEELELLELELEQRRREKMSGAKGVQGEQEPAAEGEQPDEGETYTTGDIVDGAADAANTFARSATFGLDDIAAGTGAFLGDAFQSAVDGRPRNPDAFSEGQNERRASVQQSRDRSPTSTKVGDVGGFVATLPLAAARGAGTAAKVGRGAGYGALSALGYGDADELGDAAVDVAQGAAVGGALAGLLPLLPAGYAAIASKVKAPKVLDGVIDAAVAIKDKGLVGAATSKVASAVEKKAREAAAAAAPKAAPVAPAAAPAEAALMSADDILSSSAALRAMELEAKKRALEALAAGL